MTGDLQKAPTWNTNYLEKRISKDRMFGGKLITYELGGQLPDLRGRRTSLYGLEFISHRNAIKDRPRFSELDNRQQMISLTL